MEIMWFISGLMTGISVAAIYFACMMRDD